MLDLPARSVPLKDWRDALKRRGEQFCKGDESAFRKAWKGVQDRLRAKELINIRDEYVWIVKDKIGDAPPF